MRKINKVRILSSNNEKSKRIKDTLEDLLKKYNFKITEGKCDLAIAIGGDGTFINMIHELDFDDSIYYVGVNTGTLGFLQDINPENIREFVTLLNENKFETERLSLQQTEITTKDKVYNCYSLNEIVIRDDKFKTAYLTVKVNEKNLEEFAGDGLLISTSLGSTAYNASLDGAMIGFDIHSIQITPIAPLVNRVYKSLKQSLVLPENYTITIEPSYKRDNDLLVIVDGNGEFYRDVTYVKTRISKKRISCLRMNNFDYIDKIREKFLK